ncbi:hypothetical protein MAPG_03918 [Magnaporthiopsis poae ATCC 64411]|uniref:Uncharacterized protein n=1 Tax=Magnaporthiopsis poae (strain ATCC 64411 / 73-15) TaxID=644358 RepID=A0A0C4DVB6_MAGP6|nr:hypothetical protein MAPG_03918 [Magnaporthiopsis poae ATCC 64411]
MHLSSITKHNSCLCERQGAVTGCHGQANQNEGSRGMDAMEHDLTGATEPTDGATELFSPWEAQTGLCITGPASLSVRSERAGTRIIRLLVLCFLLFPLQAGTRSVSGIPSDDRLFPSRFACRERTGVVTDSQGFADGSFFLRYPLCLFPYKAGVGPSYFISHCVRRTVGRPFFYFFVAMEGWLVAAHLRAFLHFGPAVFLSYSG